MTPEAIAEFLRTWGYPAYFAVFVATAFGAPVTEDVLVLSAGYLIGVGVFSWQAAAPLSIAGVLTTDSIVYLYGRLLRSQVVRRGGWLRRFVRPGQLRLATRWFGRFGDGVVFAARLLPGTRLIVFATAGMRGMPYWRFLVLDGLASLVYVPLFLLLGAKLGEKIGGLDRLITLIGSRVTWLIGAVVLFVLLRHLWRRWMRAFVDRELKE